MSDVDAAIEAAHERMGAMIDELRRHGLSVTGEVGELHIHHVVSPYDAPVGEAVA